MGPLCESTCCDPSAPLPPCRSRCTFAPTLYPSATLAAQLRTAFDDPAWRTRNRNGVLLGTAATCDDESSSGAAPALQQLPPVRTLTLTPSLWALYNALPAGCSQVRLQWGGGGWGGAVQCAARGGRLEAYGLPRRLSSAAPTPP